MTGSKKDTRDFGRLLIVLLAAIALGAIPLVWNMLRYFLAIYEDERCRPDEGIAATREQVEECLVFYSVSECRREDQVFGFDYSDGCVSYNILGSTPIHVVYDDSSRVQHWFSAYE